MVPESAVASAMVIASAEPVPLNVIASVPESPLAGSTPRLEIVIASVLLKLTVVAVLPLSETAISPESSWAPGSMA